MNGLEISRILLRHPVASRSFKGVYARDQLPAAVNLLQPAAYIINTDPAHKAGSHWVGVFYDGQGNIEYFDSFGLKPTHKDIEAFLLRHCCRYKSNDQVLQGMLSSTCGLFAMYFIIKKSQGARLRDIISIFNPQNPYVNDRRVISLFQRRVSATSLNLLL